MNVPDINIFVMGSPQEGKSLKARTPAAPASREPRTDSLAKILKGHYAELMNGFAKSQSETNRQMAKILRNRESSGDALLKHSDYLMNRFNRLASKLKTPASPKQDNTEIVEKLNEIAEKVGRGTSHVGGG